MQICYSSQLLLFHYLDYITYEATNKQHVFLCIDEAEEPKHYADIAEEWLE